MNTATQNKTHAILHLANHGGGGTFRYIESLIGSPETAHRHFVWHVSKNQHVLCDVAASYCYAFSADLTQEQQKAVVLTVLNNAGVTRLGIHLHSVFGAALTVAEQWARLPAPLTATFHDHHFLSEAAYSEGALVRDETHIHRVQRLLQDAQVIVPSNYLRQQAIPHFDPEKVHVVPHGSESALNKLDEDTRNFVERLKRRANWQKNTLTVAAIGAINESKGLGFMKQWLAVRGETQFVCIGYTGEAAADSNRPQAAPGIITHGYYHHAEVPALLAAYGVDLVVFFPGIPESFCYALSDIQGAVPVLAPDLGALGERVIAEKLGYTYPPDTPATALTARMAAAATHLPTPELANQTVDTMTLQTEHYYKDHLLEEIPQLILSQDELSTLLDEQLHQDNLKWEMAILVRQNDYLSQGIESLKNQREEIIAELRSHQAELDVRQSHIESQLEYIESLREELKTSQKHFHQMEHQFNGAAYELNAVKASLSWRITRPIRAIRRMFK